MLPGGAQAAGGGGLARPPRPLSFALLMTDDASSVFASTSALSLSAGRLEENAVRCGHKRVRNRAADPSQASPALSCLRRMSCKLLEEVGSQRASVLPARDPVGRRLPRRRAGGRDPRSPAPPQPHHPDQRRQRSPRAEARGGVLRQHNAGNAGMKPVRRASHGRVSDVHRGEDFAYLAPSTAGAAALLKTPLVVESQEYP